MCPLTLKNALKTLIRSVCFCLDSTPRTEAPGPLSPSAAFGPSALASRRFVWFFKILFQVFYLISYFSRPYIFSTFFLEVIRPADPTFNDKS